MYGFVTTPDEVIMNQRRLDNDNVASNNLTSVVLPTWANLRPLLDRRATFLAHFRIIVDGEPATTEQFDPAFNFILHDEANSRGFMAQSQESPVVGSITSSSGQISASSRDTNSTAPLRPSGLRQGQPPLQRRNRVQTAHRSTTRPQSRRSQRNTASNNAEEEEQEEEEEEEEEAEEDSNGSSETDEPDLGSDSSESETEQLGRSRRFSNNRSLRRKRRQDGSAEDPIRDLAMTP
jgi:hypothetical protein